MKDFFRASTVNSLRQFHQAVSLFIGIFLFTGLAAKAQAPMMINYQGKVQVGGRGHDWRGRFNDRQLPETPVISANADLSP